MSTRKGKHRDVISTAAAPSASPVADGAAENPLGATSGRRAEESSAHEINLTAPVIAEAQNIPNPQDSQSVVPSDVDGAVRFEGTSAIVASATVVSADSYIARLEEGPDQPVRLSRVLEPLEKDSFFILALVLFAVLVWLGWAGRYVLISEYNKSDSAREETISNSCSKYNDPASTEFCITRANDARNSHMKAIWALVVGGIVATLVTSLVGYFLYKGTGKHKET